MGLILQVRNHMLTPGAIYPSSDPSFMLKQDADALRKMHDGALSRRSETVNPVDRFIMLVRVRQVTGRTAFSSMLSSSGMPELLRAISGGQYDFLGRKAPSPVQRREREKVCLRMMNELRMAKVLEEYTSSCTVQSWPSAFASLEPGVDLHSRHVSIISLVPEITQ